MKTGLGKNKKMDKLMDFLQKEVPSNAKDLNNSIKATLEIIDHTRTALKSKLSEMANNLFEDSNYNEIIRNFQFANKQLKIIKSGLINLLNNNENIDLSDGKLENALIDETNIEDIAEDEAEEVKELEGKIDYKKYLVDNTKPYPLSSDFENTTPYSFSFEGEISKVKTYKDMWLKLCEILYNKDNDKFKEIAIWHQIRGRKKSYIVYKSDKIAKNISNPMRFLNTTIILEGATSTTQKINIIRQMLDIYKIPDSSIKVYLKSDRHPRHGQEPIGIYMDKTYDFRAEIKSNSNNVKNDKNITYDSDVSTGKRAYNYFQDYFANTNLSYDIQDFLNKDWCKNVFNISYPILKEIDESKPLKKQTIPEGKSGAYYAQNPKIQINNKLYIVYMQWNDKKHRVRLEKWIAEHPIHDNNSVQTNNSSLESDCIYYDFKKDICSNLNHPLFNQPCTSPDSCKYYSNKIVYILSVMQFKHKNCPNCGMFMEEDKLKIHYVKNNNPFLSITNLLLTLKCRSCNKNFINENLFKDYTRTKDLDCLDIKFIPFENQ